MSSAIEIFCCYAHEDQLMLADLKKHLMPLQRQGLIKIWSDIDLNAGDAWEKALHQHLESADIILLLISPDFMASDYCYSTEMDRAIQRHNAGSAHIIPIVLRSTYWRGTPFAKLQMLPRDALPVTSWQRQDDAYSTITEKIGEAVETAKQHKTEREQQITAMLREAHQLAEKKQYETALPLYEQILLLDPKNSLAQIGQAQAFYELHQHLKFLETLACIQEIAPSLLGAQTYQQKSDALARLEHYEEALSAINNALDIDSENVHYITQRARILYELQHYQSALDAYEQAICLQPDNADFLLHASSLLFRLRRFDKALAMWEQAIHSKVDDAGYYELQGQILYQMQRLEEALIAYEKGIALLEKEERSEVFRLNLNYIEDVTHLRISHFYEKKGEIYLQSERYEEALSAYEQAITKSKIHANTCKFRAGKGAALFHLARYDEAIASYQTAIKDSIPNSDPQYYHSLGLAYEGLAKNAYQIEEERGAKWEPETTNNFLVPYFDPLQLRLLQTLSGHTHEVNSIAIGPDSKFLMSGSDDQSAKLWNLISNQEFLTLPEHNDIVQSVAISPDYKFLASASFENFFRLWESDSPFEPYTFEGHTDDILCVTFSPDGNKIASGSNDCTIKLWDLASKSLLKTLQGHTKPVWAVAFSPDGIILASGSDDYTIKLWNVLDGYKLSTLIGHEGAISSIAFSPDGRILVSGSHDGTIKLWRVSSASKIRTLHEIRTLTEHNKAVYSVAISPDGNFIASASEDTKIRLWSLPAGRLLRTLFGHKDAVTSVAFSPSGTLLASGSADGTIKLWGVPS